METRGIEDFVDGWSIGVLELNMLAWVKWCVCIIWIDQV